MLAAITCSRSRSPAARREKTVLRERYGRNKLGQSLLLARRLVEAGVRFVNVNDKINNGQVANWDSHENNFARLKNDLLPPADRAFSQAVRRLTRLHVRSAEQVVNLEEGDEPHRRARKRALGARDAVVRYRPLGTRRSSLAAPIPNNRSGRVKVRAAVDPDAQ